ncbi:nuclear transport factor 2 family protein [Microbacterium sp. 1P10UB]|uniref:nuclear transport factor 2 family protein n=1 Tax=unclassified Microbacterium TaxID=2609290 RepID=UPI00399FBDE3
MDRTDMSAAARAWVAAYEKAWASNDESDIRALFTDDGAYRTEPWSAPWRGADAIVVGWVSHADEPDDYSFTYDLAGVDGERVFIEGRTVYSATDSESERDYRNLWVIDLAPDGRARSFTEWYMRRRD